MFTSCYCLHTNDERNRYTLERKVYANITRSYDRDNALYDCDFMTLLLLLFETWRKTFLRGTVFKSINTYRAGRIVNQARGESIEYVEPQ